MPTQSRPLNVSFSLTCARESLTLVYHDSMLMSLVPTRGSVFGGTVVTLTISSSIWSPLVHIQFGSIISQCSWNNSQHICHSPSVGQAVVNTIFLSLDGGLSFFQTAFSWEHFYAPVVRQITPSKYACASGASITVTLHISHVTRHTSHVTCHTSHVTRHLSHVTRHTSHVNHPSGANPM